MHNKMESLELNLFDVITIRSLVERELKERAVIVNILDMRGDYDEFANGIRDSTNRIYFLLTKIDLKIRKLLLQ